MNTVSPVIPGLKHYEIELGGKQAKQPEYDALPALRSPEGLTVTRWSPTDDERAAIANGADIYVSVLTFNQPFQAQRLTVGFPGESDGATVTSFKRDMRLDDDFEMRTLRNDSNKAVADLQARQMAILNGDAEVKNLAERAQKARQMLERKKGQVFRNEPKKVIEVVQ